MSDAEASQRARLRNARGVPTKVHGDNPHAMSPEVEAELAEHLRSRFEPTTDVLRLLLVQQHVAALDLALAQFADATAKKEARQKKARLEKLQKAIETVRQAIDDEVVAGLMCSSQRTYTMDYSALGEALEGYAGEADTELALHGKRAGRRVEQWRSGLIWRVVQIYSRNGVDDDAHLQETLRILLASLGENVAAVALKRAIKKALLDAEL